MIQAAAIVFLLISSIGATTSSSTFRGPGSGNPADWQITDGQSVLLHSDTSSLSAMAGRETAGPDTFLIYGGPDRIPEGRFEDTNGSSSWNGWSSTDVTDVPIFWHVNTFNAENLNSNGPGNHAMWSGQSALDQPDWATAPGYGNWWNDGLVYESAPVANPGSGQTVSLDFFFNHDLEPLYDFFIVEYDSAGSWTTLYSVDSSNKDISNVFADPGIRYSDVATTEIIYVGNDYGGDAFDRIRVRLRVATDGSYSDEDGQFVSTAGAVQIDDITLTTAAGVFTEDFEGPGPYLLKPDKSAFAGDFAEVYPGFQDLDPCRSNFTPAVGFIDYGQDVRNGPGVNGLSSTGGSTSPGVNYGIGGSWVTNYNGGLTLGELAFSNFIVSPEIAWDLPGANDDDADLVGSSLRFDVWQDLPLANGIFHTWEVRSAAVGGEFSPWQFQGWFFYSLTPVWLTRTFELSSDLVANPERVQVRLWALDLADAFGFPGQAGTPSPLYDNVVISKYRVGGIKIGAAPLRIPNDSFPPTGSIDVSTPAARDALDVPIDMAGDVNSGDLFIVPGDSLVVSAEALIPGTAMQDLRMVWAMQTNALFEDAIRSAPTGINHLNVIAGPAGTIWSGEVVADSCTSAAGEIVADKYFFDLPDVDFMYPGDVIQYYVRATDTDGRVSTLPSDLAGFGNFDHVYPRYGTARALPSIKDSAGTQPPILVLNNQGKEVNFPELRQSLTQLGMTEGVDFDIYWRRAAHSSPNSNGIGSAGAHGASVQQLSGYSTLLYFSRNLLGFLLSNGTNGPAQSKSNDISLLEAWHKLPGQRNAAYFGDRLAEFLAFTPEGLGYLNNMMGVQYEGGDVVPFIGGQLSPLVRPTHPGFTTEFLPYFNCQIDASDETNVGVIPHNHVTPAPGAFYGHQYVDSGSGQPISGPAASVVFANTQPGVTGYDVTFPYSISWLYPRAQRGPTGLSDRTVLLQELLELFAEGPGGGVVVSAPTRASLALSVAPNPFNPRTTIHFDVAPGQSGAVRVFTLRGELVTVLHRGEYQTREFSWDGADQNGNTVASGVYLVQASADGEVRVAKVALVR